MKKILSFTLFIAIAMLLLPLAVISPAEKTVADSTVVKDEPLLKSEITKAESFKILVGEEIIELPSEEYIFGVVAAEMPALYHEEALKAQAVAAYTFACRRRAENADKDYDITADHTTDQSFITEAAAREKWGDNADEYVTKIKKAVEATKGLILTYNGEIITAAYHAISSGRTEDCKNVWGSELAYLKPVVSEGDKLSSGYISEAVFTIDELKERLKSEVAFEGEPQNYFGKITCTDSGTVSELAVCSKKLTGFKIQKLLDLRSANFEIKYQDNSFTFTVYGAGHGVGMSQNGANYMAKQGSSFEEILSHYYTGCKIIK